jgi:hypothetical protein
MLKENYGGIDGDAARKALGDQISNMDVAKAQVLGELAKGGISLKGVSSSGVVKSTDTIIPPSSEEFTKNVIKARHEQEANAPATKR